MNNPFANKTEAEKEQIWKDLLQNSKPIGTRGEILTRITINPEVRSGKPCIRNLRITVQDIAEYMQGGMSNEQILADFPELESADLLAVVLYCTK